MILPVFGALPSGKSAARVKHSPNYRDKQFQNPEPTEMMVKSASIVKLMLKFFNKPAITQPSQPVPSVLTDLRQIDDNGNPVIVWFGHSSYCIWHKGKTILVDPVFSGYASPFSFTGKAFKGSNTYGVPDFGKIDLLIITHDHYDHLDYRTIRELKGKVDKIVTSLGVGAHLELWGVDPGKIIELDWWDGAAPFDGIRLTAAPARHFSGRMFKRNQSLWSSFVLNLNGFNILVGGDSGYGGHFKEIGERFGPFDLAILEAGQYNSDWPYIHMFPRDAVLACNDLRTEAILPVHWSKFALAFHPWNDPPKKIMEAFKGSGVHVILPMIGEPVVIGKEYTVDQWWSLAD